MTEHTVLFPVNDIRGLFPQLSVPVNGQPLVYLDSAATSLKLGISLNKELDFSSHEIAAVNRGAHTFCLLYTSPSPRDLSTSRMPSSA